MRVKLAWSSAIAAVCLVTACATGLLQPEPDAGGNDASCSTCNDGGPTGDAQSDAHPPGPDGGCNTGETKCLLDSGPLCANVQTDPNHCGTCTTSCIPNVQTCTAGACVNNCGTKTLCMFDAGADAGDASVPPPYCADLQTDSKNCGACGVSCGTQTCTAGKCPCTGGSQTFNYTGSQQTFVVPCGTQVTITAYGAQGANAQDVMSSKHTGGLGGSATGTLSVKPGDTLYINVGGQGNTNGSGGFNGGGAGGSSTAGSGCSGGPAGGGGGMSDVRYGGSALTNIVIAAAGGGGSGRDYCNGTCVPCGCGGGNGGGGGSTGTAGGAAYNCGYNYPGSGINGGQGGTQSTGGAGGTGDGSGASGSVGTQGSGGGGAAGSYDVAGGGGGGGYYGGGGGGSAASGSGVGGGGGGGGSSYVGGVTNGSTSAGVQSGDGKITITWQ